MRSRPESRNRTIQRERARPNRRPRDLSSERGRPNRPSREATIERTPPDRPREVRGERGEPRRPTLDFDRPTRRPGAPQSEHPTNPRGGGPPEHEFDGRPPNLHDQIDVNQPDGASSLRRRQGRAAPGPRVHHRRHHHGYRGHHRHRHYYGCGHYGYGYDPYYWGFGFYFPFSYWDLSLGYHRGYGYYSPDVYVSGGAYERGRDVAMGALDLDIKPRDAEVYVDGNYVGVADQYDGFPAYLWLEEGTHELAFYKEGYETIFRRYTIYPGVTIDVDDRLREGESVHPSDPALLAPAELGPGLPAPPVDADTGRIAVAATPGDAAVYLDGHFVGTAAEITDLAAGLIVEPGDHLIEVIRPGYETRSRPISVAAGERIDLKLDLEVR